MKKAPMTPADIDRLAASTEDAYSFDRYANWHACARMLARRGYSFAEAECILRSKWMRWAGNSSTARYGRVTSADLGRFIDGMKNRAQHLAAMLRQ